MALIIACTGHRPSKLGNDYALVSPLIKAIRRQMELIILERMPTEMISGMALGIDTLWAELALELRIPLIAAIPNTQQPNRWPIASQERYYNILKKADRIVNVSGSEEFKMWHLQSRNQWMVNNSDVLLAVWNEQKQGGTWNCVEYAQSMEREIIIINPLKINNICSTV